MRLLEFSPRITDSGYTLWYRNIGTQPYKFISIDNEYNPTHGYGWSTKENDGFWAVNSLSRVYLPKPNKTSFLTIKASSLAIPQRVKIFVNQRKVIEVELTRELKSFKFPISDSTLKQINVITFRFSNSAIP
ncbi:MAG: hypothetical protein ACD_26C00126G0001, partial [uncultured bacterium]